MDIAAISETHLLEEGELVEKENSYTYYWIGRPATEKRGNGVGFAIKTSVAQSLTELPKGVSDRLMTIRLTLTKDKYATLISAYAPTLMASDEDKGKFYGDLRYIIEHVQPTDKILLLGDFNARVGVDHVAWSNVLGPHGIGNCNSNGLDLLTFCTQFELAITNTYFRLPAKHKTTWMHPRSKHWHLIDYVIVRRKDLKDVLITRAMRGANGWTDHRLVRAKLRIVIQRPRRAPHKKPIRALCSNLVQNNVASAKLDSTYYALSNINQPDINSIDSAWDTIVNNLSQAATDSLTLPAKKHQDWFDDNDLEIKSLLDDHRRLLQNPSVTSSQRTSIQRALKQKIRSLKDTWWLERAHELQRWADTNQTGKFYQSLQTVFGPRVKKVVPMRTADGSKRLTDKTDILSRWTEHFQSVFDSSSSTFSSTCSEDVPHRSEISHLDDPPTFLEMRKSIQRLQNGKAPGADGLPPEIFKYGGPCIHNDLFDFILKIWDQETIPQAWKDASICTLYKGKGDASICGSYRGISLLAVAGKILAHIINTRLSALAEEILPESQCGFRPNRGTIDAIFVVKQMQEKCLEQQQPLYLCFVDLEKAFDRVPREALWGVLRRSGCPPKFLDIIRQFHDSMMGRVQFGDGLSEGFPVTCGVKQGCVMAPTLFGIYFGAVITDAIRSCDDTICISVRTDKGVFDLSRFRAKGKCNRIRILDVLYADDACFMASTPTALQSYMNQLYVSCKRFGLTISSSKTQILVQPPRGNPPELPSIFLGESALEVVSHFRYLGSEIRNDNRLETEIPARIARASSAFGKLNKRVW